MRNNIPEGDSKIRKDRWTPEETVLLIENKSLKNKELFKLFPDRTAAAVSKRVRLYRDKKRAKRRTITIMPTSNKYKPEPKYRSQFFMWAG